LTGDRSQWDARWTKGLPALVQSTVTGLNGMPPGGQCFACSAADYEALIQFLAGRP
jgi:cytochrome c5